jgi:membrane protease YdiL (CAAX protease family)
MLSGWKRPEIIFVIWTILALAILLPVTYLLNGSFPFFTVIWIFIPLVAVVRTKDASRVGFRAVPWRECAWVSAVNLCGLFVIMLIIEPWSHTYQKLLEAALSSPSPDTTFAWLLRFQGNPALAAMFLYSGMVTLFGEELFFRGWLLQLLRKHWGTPRAIIIQAFLFVIPNLLVAFVLPPLQGVLYVLVYTWLAIGIIGGWAASRTGSIWPSLISATVGNLVFVALIA